MTKLFGMNERMNNAWDNGFSAMPPLFWLPFFFGLLLCSVIWLSFCIAGWLIGFYACERCEGVRHRTINRRQTIETTNRYGNDVYDEVCTECFNKHLKEPEKKRTRPAPPPPQGISPLLAQRRPQLGKAGE